MIQAIHLTEEQRQAIDAHRGRPVEFIDPISKRVYVLIASEAYEPVREAPEEKWPKAERGTSQPGVWSAGALRPAGVQGARVRWRDLGTPPGGAQAVRRLGGT